MVWQLSPCCYVSDGNVVACSIGWPWQGKDLGMVMHWHNRVICIGVLQNVTPGCHKSAQSKARRAGLGFPSVEDLCFCVGLRRQGGAS